MLYQTWRRIVHHPLLPSSKQTTRYPSGTSGLGQTPPSSVYSGNFDRLVPDNGKTGYLYIALGGSWDIKGHNGLTDYNDIRLGAGVEFATQQRIGGSILREVASRFYFP